MHDDIDILSKARIQTRIACFQFAAELAREQGHVSLSVRFDKLVTQWEKSYDRVLAKQPGPPLLKESDNERS
jgi:hypothetical protein